MDAARQLFAERGLKPNLNDVAHRAGLGVGTVYRRFATKDELIEAIFVDGLDQLTALAEEGLRHDDPWEGFVWFVQRMCEITATDRGFREIAVSKVFASARVSAAKERLGPPLAQLVENAQSDGRLWPDFSSTDMPIITLLAGMVSDFAGDVNPDLWRRYVGLLLDGMRCHPSQDPLVVDALGEHGLDAAMGTGSPQVRSMAAHRPKPAPPVWRDAWLFAPP
nr:TetR/AcrR family transcriptional regulator [Mycolicibacterium aromaticivorans]